VTTRPARSTDMARVAEIYTHQVLHGIGTFDVEPQSAEAFETRRTSTAVGDHFLVADDGSAVVGFAYSGAFRPHAAYAGTRESSIYLDPLWCGHGIGRQLYGALLEAVDASGIHTVLAVIARPNPAGEALHTRLGFRRIGVLEQVGRKFDRWIDTGWWQRFPPP